MADQLDSAQTIDANGKPYNRLVMVLTLLVGTFGNFLTSTILTTAFPTLMRDFNISANTVQWLTTGFMLVMGITIPIAAFLLQRFSTKRLYLTAMGTFFTGTLICFFAPTFAVLLVGRLVQATAVGISAPVFQTIMAAIFPPAKRGTAMGTAGLVIGLAPAIGPTLSGWILQDHTWRALFLVILPITGTVFIVGQFTLRKVLKTHFVKVDWLSVLLSTTGFGGMLFAFSSVGDNSWGAPIVYGPLIAGLIIAIFFAVRQLRISNPILQLKVFKSPAFTLSAILVAIVNMSMIGFEMILPLYIQTVRGDSAFQSGLILLPGAVMMGIMSPFTGRIFDQLGGKRLAITGMFLLLIGSMFFLTITDKTPILFITIMYAIRMFGVTMVNMPVTTTGINALPLRLLGDGTSVNNTMRQVVSSMGTAVMISIMSNVTASNLPSASLKVAEPVKYGLQALNANIFGYRMAFAAATLFALIGFGLAFFLKDRPYHVKEDEAA
ncbi:DHA2 family efflux MFS transporter permease subunit [Secundilactobacillus kimchicus]|nr:MDR family MFS transporter [Secundilactobacillus kimchicus]MBT9672677.1 DHA2 family efflux MFS transporter permease subunit [Secundilactobacillus kimchicus]